jgi:hypothetical protein
MRGGKKNSLKNWWAVNERVFHIVQRLQHDQGEKYSNFWLQRAQFPSTFQITIMEWK